MVGVNRTVRVDIDSKEVVRGTDYKGFLRIGAKQYIYSISSSTSIDTIPNDIVELQKAIRLEVRRKGRVVNLDEKEGKFIIALSIGIASEILRHPARPETLVKPNTIGLAQSFDLLESEIQDAGIARLLRGA